MIIISSEILGSLHYTDVFLDIYLMPLGCYHYYTFLYDYYYYIMIQGGVWLNK